jgi:hypothetical protein
MVCNFQVTILFPQIRASCARDDARSYTSTCTNSPLSACLELPDQHPAAGTSKARSDTIMVTHCTAHLLFSSHALAHTYTSHLAIWSDQDAASACRGGWLWLPVINLLLCSCTSKRPVTIVRWRQQKCVVHYSRRPDMYMHNPKFRIEHKLRR